MEKITIDLEWEGTGRRTATGSSGTVENSIHSGALRRVLTKLAVKPLEDEAERDDPRSSRPLTLNVMPRRRHNAILVSARRGDGKTTFLTGILQLIEEGREKYLPFVEDTKKDDVATLYSLGIVDPTLIETKQNIVVIVMEKIKAAADRAYRFDESGKRGEYEDFKRALHELAAGLTLLDGIGDSPLTDKDWADADYVLERGLDKARGAGAFERAFHRYVEKASKLLRMDAFVLAIDDVDTSFDRGWPVLEAIRKYFATPRLKILLAGQLELYNVLVRQQQWKQIGRDFFDVERKADRSRSYADQLVQMVDVLQDQYLIKIAPPENRVKLPPLLHLADSGGGINFRTSRFGPEPRMDEHTVLGRFARHLLAIRASEDVALIRATLLRLPLRSGLQVIAGAWDLVGSDSPPSDRDRRPAIDVLSQVASTSLISLDLNEYELDDPRSGRVLGALIQWLTKKGLWLSMQRFHPGGVDETTDLVSVRIAARLVELFRREPRATIDFWLQLCVIRDKLERGEVDPAPGEAAKVSPKDTDRADLRTFLLHLNADRSDRLIQFVSRLAAWDAVRGRQLARGIRLSGASVPATARLREANAGAFELYGIRGTEFKRDVFREVVESKDQSRREQLLNALPAPLRGYHEKLMDAEWSYSSRRGIEVGFIATFANTLASLRHGLDSQVRSIAMLPAFGITSGQGSENGGYSVLRLIATLAEVLGTGSASRDEERKDDVEKLIQTLAQFRSYPTPGLFVGDDRNDNSDDTSEEGAESESDLEEDGDEPSTLATMLTAWSKNFYMAGGTIAVAPLTLARIWTRFAYAFDDIVSELRHTESRYLGVLMHRSITAFLHAVGVEAVRAAGRMPGKKAIDNPITSSLPFNQLLRVLDDTQDIQDDPNVRFFRAIFAYPLWGYFLARSEQDISGKKDRVNATEEVFKRYLTAVFKVVGQAPDYRAKFRRAGKEAEFDGLYFLLNSVQLQGLPQPRQTAARGGVKLQETLEELGKASPPTKRGPGRPRQADSPQPPSAAPSSDS